MSRPRLLLLLPSTTYRAAAFVEAARKIGADLTVASDHVSTLAGVQPEGLIQLDFVDLARAADQARAFAAQHPLAAVCGVDDDTAVVAAAIAEALSLAHNPVEACLAARDKRRQRVILTREALPVPPFALYRFGDDLAARARTAPYPCVLKPTRLAMSRGVIRADDPAQFLAAAERLRRLLAEPEVAASCGEDRDAFLVERFVPGPEFALEGLLEGGALTVLALFDKPDPLDGPFFEETIYATPSRLAKDVQLRIASLVERSAAALGLVRGPVHAEVRVGEGGPWLIELAARPIGGRCSAVLRFGPDGKTSLEELLLRRALGLSVASIVREATAAAVMMIPTREAGELKQIHGVNEARRVPWVDDVVITVHPGQNLVPLPEGSRYLGFIYAYAEDPETAVQAVREAFGMLRVELA